MSSCNLFNRISFIFFLLIFVLVFYAFNVDAGCWERTTSSTCNADTASNCVWKNDSWGGWCQELSCWSLYSNSECTSTVVPGKNCTWQGGGVSYTCEKMSCWSFSGTSESQCESNAAGLNCDWSDYCYSSGSGSGGSSVNCWERSNQSSCLNATGCSWGNCYDKGCWSYTTNTTCNVAKDWNGKNCTWDAGSGNGYCNQNGCWKYWQNQTTCEAASGGLSCQWKWNSCQDIDCWTWDYTNQTACVNNSYNLSCTWSNSWCQKQDCWSYTTNTACSAKPSCVWRSYATSGWCQEINCWTWDGWSGGSETACTQNSSIYGLDCAWNYGWDGSNSSGWCYKNVAALSCANITTERTCMDTYYCWWQFNNTNNASGGGSCREPGGFGGAIINTSILNDWNPGCYIFDMNSTDCNNTLGCNYTVATAKCDVLNNAYGGNISLNGINCTYINDSRLCNSLPVLSSCCAWQNGTCVQNKLSSTCRDQVQAPPAGAGFCEDYSSYENQALCEQIAGYPWYMPCKWDNSTSRCGFKADDVFGNDSMSLVKIDNKRSCEAAGGKWITENYCEGNLSVPTGRCEYKFDEEANCDKACFACEVKDSSGGSVNATSAEAACKGSKLGFCEFAVSTNAPNGIGYCNAKEQFKKGVAVNCDSVCGDCGYKGDPKSNDTTKRPSYYCTASKANSLGGGCKWIVDNSTSQGGYCVDKGEKTCEDICDRCKTQTTCQNNGRTSVSNQTGSCKWQGDTNTGSCVPNIGEDVEICWDGMDNNGNSLIDCADAACYADTFCGFVEGDCFGWTNQPLCQNATGCEWVVDKWGSWCDFKGGQCWKYNFNEGNCSTQTNCQWHNGTGGSWCEQDWSKSDVCMGVNRTTCEGLDGQGCNWTVDSWCSGSGNSTDWCRTSGGWCEYELFKPKDCWRYTSGSTECGNQSGCGWHRDEWSTPHCEVNWSASCWEYYNTSSCSNAGCYWKSDSWGGWCTNVMDKCWSSYNQSTCNSQTNNAASICYWESNTWGGWCQPLCFNSSAGSSSACVAVPGCVWKEENGWCEDKGMATCSNSTNYNNGSNCLSNADCRWKGSGWCDPKEGGFTAAASAGGGGVGTAMGGDCYKYDGNQSWCTNKTLINISCGWTAETNSRCEVDWSKNCWQYTSVVGGCNATNGCWFSNNTWGAYCTNVVDQCWQNYTYQSWNNTEGWRGNCSSNQYCINDSWGCQPKCLTQNTTVAACNMTYCKYITGWCNPSTMNEMFTGMESGVAAPIGFDACGEPGMQASVDICGFGMKDMGDSYGFGTGVNNFENASVCNKEKLSSFVMGQAGGGGSSGSGGGGAGTAMTTFGAEKTGSGNETVTAFVYLDTDGNATTGGCELTHNSSAIGYEFRFKYSSVWNANTSKAAETFNAYKCDAGDWKAADIKLSSWKKKMCGEIGGPMIAVKKSDLTKFPSLYDSTKDMRIAVATIGNTGNITTPTDSAGPGWITPGSADFEIVSAFSYGADSAKFEDILRKGFVQGEDCFNSVDDDGDGNLDCNDWDCQYSDQCGGLGVNAASYADTSSPLVTGVKIEEYTDAALVMYDTNKPTNGTLELYNYGDTQCLNKTNDIYDVGILKNNTLRKYKLWHYAMIYNTNETANNLNVSLNWPLASGSTYNYKLRVCDSSGKCAVSKCSSIKIPSSERKCGYCNFVARIKTPSIWKVAYDVDRNEVYEHVQGEVCGPNAGLKMNYTAGRKVNVKLYKADNSTYIEFLNATLTKTGLNDKVRTISTSGAIIHDTSAGIVGLTSETRDKIINNLHPEACRVKIPFTGTCDTLYHCDDNGANCTDRTTAAGGAPINATTCVWNIPYCEFSTYAEAPTTTTTTTTTLGGGGSSGGGGGGSSGAAAATTPVVFDMDFSKPGITETQIQAVEGKVLSFSFDGGSKHSITVNSVKEGSAVVTIQSSPVTVELLVGETKNVDMNNDGLEDLGVSLISIIGKNVNLKISKLAGAGAVDVAVTTTTTLELGFDSTTITTLRTADGGGAVKEAKKSNDMLYAVGFIVFIIIITAITVIYFKRASKKGRK